MCRLIETLSHAACSVLMEPAPVGKVERTRSCCSAWRTGAINSVGGIRPPERPARPERPVLQSAQNMPRRRHKGQAGRFAFVHAIAHIEFNAIDLAWDIVSRFTAEEMPKAFYDDWVQVALDEAEHFQLLQTRLSGLGGAYGDLPAHDGLWEAASSTADDLLARLAYVPMMLEARGLDTTPRAVEKLRQAGDKETADILEHIAHEEIPHVQAGVRWFEYLCDQRDIEPVSTFHELVSTRFKAAPKPPFNEIARSKAGMAASYYQPFS